MLQRFVDDFKSSTGASLKMASLIALAGFAGFIAVGFACAGAFIALMREYGPITACVALAAVFAVVAIIVAVVHAQKQKRAREHAAAAARHAARAAASMPKLDPMMVMTGLQIARTLGLKKVIPLLALAGIALGYMATRNSASDDEAGEENDEATDEA